METAIGLNDRQWLQKSGRDSTRIPAKKTEQQAIDEQKRASR